MSGLLILILIWRAVESLLNLSNGPTSNFLYFDMEQIVQQVGLLCHRLLLPHGLSVFGSCIRLLLTLALHVALLLEAFLNHCTRHICGIIFLLLASLSFFDRLFLNLRILLLFLLICLCLLYIFWALGRDFFLI